MGITLPLPKVFSGFQKPEIGHKIFYSTEFLYTFLIFCKVAFCLALCMGLSHMTCSKLLQNNITISILFINFGFEMLAGNKCVLRQLLSLKQGKIQAA